LAKSTTLSAVTRVCHERAAQLAPPCWLTDVDESSYPALSQSEYGVRRLGFELAQECNGRNTGKLPDKRSNAESLRTTTGDGDQHGMHLL
jgi:hypothetical protein